MRRPRGRGARRGSRGRELSPGGLLGERSDERRVIYWDMDYSVSGDGSIIEAYSYLTHGVAARPCVVGIVAATTAAAAMMPHPGVHGLPQAAAQRIGVAAGRGDQVAGRRRGHVAQGGESVSLQRDMWVWCGNEGVRKEL